MTFSFVASCEREQARHSPPPPRRVNTRSDVIVTKTCVRTRHPCSPPLPRTICTVRRRPDGPALLVRARSRQNFGLVARLLRAPSCVGRSPMLHRSRLVFAILALLALVSGNALAQGSTPFTAEKMWSLDRLGPPTIAPDGKVAVLPVTRYAVAENKGLTDLWIIP